MKTMMIPGLNSTRELEQCREDSQRFARLNLNRQIKAKITASMLDNMREVAGERVFEDGE